jgi:excisionase family DNA binding protein
VGTRDQRGRDVVSVDEAASLLGSHRNTVFSLIKSGTLVKVKIPGVRAWQITVESIDDYLAAKGMTLTDLSARVVKLERLVQTLLNKSARQPTLPHPAFVDQTIEAEHDSDLVQEVLRKIHPERFQDLN